MEGEFIVCQKLVENGVRVNLFKQMTLCSASVIVQLFPRVRASVWLMNGWSNLGMDWGKKEEEDAIKWER